MKPPARHEEKPPARAPIDDLLARLTEALKEHGYTIRPVEPEESA